VTADFRCAPSPSKTEACRSEVYASFAVVTLTIVSYATAERWQQRDTMNAMISFGVDRNFELVQGDCRFIRAMLRTERQSRFIFSTIGLI
jgi:hypothetical protein